LLTVSEELLADSEVLLQILPMQTVAGELLALPNAKTLLEVLALESEVILQMLPIQAVGTWEEPIE